MNKKIVMSDYRVVAKSFDKRQAKQDGLPLWMRIAHAAGAEMNRSGHAYFGGWSNIADYVKVDGSPLPGRAKVYEGVKKAIQLGYLHPDSDVDCLVFYSADTQKAAHSGYGCKSPKHKVECREIEEIVEALESVPAGIDPLTGEVLEEAVDAPESTQEVSEESEPALEDEKAVEPVVEAPEELPAVNVDETEEDDIDLDEIEWDTELANITEKEAVDMTEKEFADWYDTASDLEKDVAAYGHVYKKFDALAMVVLVAQESVKDEYNWCLNASQRYTYAAMNVSYDGPGREKKELVKASSNDLMDQDW